MGGTSWAARDQFSAAVPSLSALWWEADGDAPRRLVYDKRTDRSPSASFAQVNAEMADGLRDYVLERARSCVPTSAIDAYAGAGEAAIALASRGIPVTAIELDADASAWSGSRLALPSRAVQGRVEDVLPEVLPADLVIVNPPRAGMDARVTEILEAHAGPVRAVIYVSCNPATLGRDLSRMPSYRIESIRAFDMFPQTAHVETVCELRASGAIA
jgi:23S rRNA (uracil1939-C5)-methyltransferase